MKRTALALILIMALLFSVVIKIQLTNSVSAQTYSTITIKPDGSIVGTDKIQRRDSIYTFTGNVSGSILAKKSNIVIDGAGFTLHGSGDTAIEISSGEFTEHPSELDIWNVTVKNLRIVNFHIGIRCTFGGNHTFYGEYISNDVVTKNETRLLSLSWESLGIALWGSTGNNITHCTIGGSPAIYMHFACGSNIVIENNIIFGADLAISGDEIFDRNYWGDYMLRYPSALEVDSSGVWNMPYAFADSTGFENRTFQDNHPLVSPLSIPIFLSVLPKVQSVQEAEVFRIMLVAIFVLIVFVSVIGVGLGLLIYIIKRK
jgi:hypothetical protein